MSTKPTSLEAAVREAAGESQEPARQEEQRSLFGGGVGAGALDQMRDADGRLPSNVFQMARSQSVRGPGRPKGARNKRNDDLAKLITHQRGDPVQFMASLYSTPLDHMAEMLLVADGTQGRQNKLDALIEELSGRITGLIAKAKDAGTAKESIEAITAACEALADAARRTQGKPGDLAIKALNVQLAAAKAVSEYVHSKKPVEANVSVSSDGVIIMPGRQGSSFETLDDETRNAGTLIAQALRSGQIEAAQLDGYALRDGQLVDADFEDVPEDGADGEDG